MSDGDQKKPPPDGPVTTVDGRPSRDTVIDEIEQLLGRQAIIERHPFHPTDVPATWANISRARELLGWEPRVGLKEGLASAVDWYTENRAWAKEIEL